MVELGVQCTGVVGGVLFSTQSHTQKHSSDK
uniref:Uncharacterized protein n=1 Tax=Anguilla anguilla TaxID=7936 RepID=A0A0E9TQ94_ANGAN